MTTLIKRCAAAANKARTAYMGCTPPLTDEMIARAVIEAMREPTQEQTDAAVDYYWHRTNELLDDECNGVWRAMIDAALP